MKCLYLSEMCNLKVVLFAAMCTREETFFSNTNKSLKSMQLIYILQYCTNVLISFLITSNFLCPVVCWLVRTRKTQTSYILYPPREWNCISKSHLNCKINFHTSYYVESKVYVYVELGICTQYFSFYLSF